MSIEWHTLDREPSLPGLYSRAATRRKITGTQLPDSGLRCWVDIDNKRLAAYRKVCGFVDDGLLPPTYPHILAFALQMQLLTAREFPFPLLGLIHLSNRIRVLRPMGGISRAQVSVRVTNLQAHPKGATFDLLTTLDDQLGPLWEAESQMLCRTVKLPGEPAAPLPALGEGLNEVSRWQAFAIGAVPVAAMLVWSPLWVARLGQGPFERLWRAGARRLS